MQMALRLYDWQAEYLKTLPHNVIMTADTGCFAKGTRVLMWDKTYKNIEDVVAGDMVKTSEMHNAAVENMQMIDYCPKPMIEFEYEERTKSTKGSRRETASDNESQWHYTRHTIRATYDHPFYDGSRYYPLYQFVWRNLEASQRLQLQLLCKQYGQVIDHTPSRGITSSDTQTWERFERLPTDSAERQDSQGTSSGSPDLVAEPDEPTNNQPYRQRQGKQSSGKSGMVYSQAQRSTRLQSSVVSSSHKSQSEVQRPDNSSDMGLVGRTHKITATTQPSQFAYPNKTIHGIARTLSANSTFGTQNYPTEKIEISNIKILGAEPYYAITMSGAVKTYVVENLPVHNTGKTLMAIKHAQMDLPILVVAPPAKVNSGDWQEIAEMFERKLLAVSFGKVARLATPDTPYILVVDEIHYAKSATSQRAKAIIRLASSFNCKQIIGLSATAIPNGYMDLQTYGIIWRWWKNKTAFIKQHVLVDRSRGYPRIIGYRGEDRLKQLWQSVAFGLDKAHLKLPDLINITSVIKLSNRERDVYNMMKSERETEDGEMLDTPAKLHATLRQFLAPSRVEALQAILDDTDEHVLVFYNYNVERDQILAVAAKNKREVYEQSGHASHLPKGVPSKPSITLLQYQSGSAGLNLQYAPISIFFSPSYSYMDTEQAKGRNYRGGQEKIVRHYWFKCDRTIDTSVYRCLENKQDFNDSMEGEQDGSQ
jgi:hypothetical protein